MLLETFRHILKPREKLLNLDIVYKSINFWLYSTRQYTKTKTLVFIISVLFEQSEKCYLV